MTGFAVTDVALQAASFELGVVVEDLRTDFATVRAAMDGLLDSGWSGAAATSFGVGWQDWVRGYGDAMSALESMASLLGETGRTYGSAETDSLDTVQLAGAPVL